MKQSERWLPAVLLLALGAAARGEDGSKLWLRYARIADTQQRESYQRTARQIVLRGNTPTLRATGEELRSALSGLLGSSLPFAEEVTSDGAIVIGEREPVGEDGFHLYSKVTDGHRATIIACSTDLGALYGTFHLLRLMQSGGDVAALDLRQSPRYRVRILNHWDNLDGSIERGYAGKSLWRWDELPAKLDRRYTAYARADASIGINGAVLNNVNASPQSLSSEYLSKTAALAELWRPWGIRVYLAANFAAPKRLGQLPTADPLDPRVAAWWRAKADEIYRLIPDFGGFLVKANSEGQPGPQDYHRTHADGANLLADALAPHGGIVLWRAFVYDQKDPDRAKRAYLEFTPLDGKFRPNVLIQAKNGPVDFQPREPFHPLLGAMKQTKMAAELQITQENLGQQKHLVYLAPMWKEFLDSDTCAAGEGSPVSGQIAGVAGVANIGDDVNWCGHDFAQANWYAFGRLAWDPSLSAEQIADEWLAMTFSTDATTRSTLRSMMMRSYETFVSYSEPLGLHHWVAGDHYAPAPWHDKDVRPEFTATYYHQADADGIGFDRTSRGSDAVGQYRPPVRDRFADIGSCPEKFLLWFHHMPWTHRMHSGRTLWEELCASYQRGAEDAKAMETTWLSLADQVDPERHRAVAQRLAIQSHDAAAWRDKCLGYFQSINRLPMPANQGSVR